MLGGPAYLRRIIRRCAGRRMPDTRLLIAFAPFGKGFRGGTRYRGPGLVWS